MKTSRSLQSPTSEELETLNEELQATVEELNTTNEELGARGNELERHASERQNRASELERLIQFYETALSQVAAVFYIVRNRRIAVASTRYEELQALNPGLLSATGDQWREPASQLQLDSGNGESLTYRASVKPAGDSVWLVTLESA